MSSTSELWSPKSYQFILESKGTFVPNVKKLPQGIPEIWSLQERDNLKTRLSPVQRPWQLGNVICWRRLCGMIESSRSANKRTLRWNRYVKFCWHLQQTLQSSGLHVRAERRLESPLIECVLDQWWTALFIPAAIKAWSQRDITRLPLCWSKQTHILNPRLSSTHMHRPVHTGQKKTKNNKTVQLHTHNRRCKLTAMRPASSVVDGGLWDCRSQVKFSQFSSILHSMSKQVPDDKLH